MSRHRRWRFSEHTFFALLLLEFGVAIPLLSAFSAPPLTPPSADTQVIVRQPAQLASAPTAALEQPPLAATVVQPALGQSEPTATPPLPTLEIVPTAVPLATAPEQATAAPAADAPQPIPTLFPTLPAVSQPPAAPLPTPDAPAGGPPPILMYHYIRSVDAGNDQLGYDLSMAPDLFDAQMAWLHEQGYTTMRMDAAARCIRGEQPCPAKAVALTFDDGYADAFTDALPVLQRYGFTATFYIISGFVGHPGYMSWEQIGALRDAGMEIGAHTVNHPDLIYEEPAVSEYEIVQSKTDLEQHLGISVASFCYPTGLYNWTVEEQTRAAGYLSATTTRWDSDYSDILALPRRRISGGTGVDGFAAIVQGY
jgi:peptidoglycan/xylan/chitin deacetylase (PgdA/CDA1 family)